MADTTISALPERTTVRSDGRVLFDDTNTGTTTFATWANVAVALFTTFLAFLQAGTDAIARTVRDKLREHVTVEDFGAVGDGETDDTAAIRAAIAHVMALGGGRVSGRKGAVYFCDDTTSRALTFPNGPVYADTEYDIEAHFHIVEPDHLWLDFAGCTFRSEKEDREFVFLLDGPRNCRLDIGRIEGVTDGDASTGTLTTDGASAIGIVTSTRDAYNNEIPQLEVDHCRIAIEVIAPATSSYRARGLRIGAVRTYWCYYGIGLFNSGNNTAIASLVSDTVARAVFFYGVAGVTGNVSVLAQMGGFQSLIKAYKNDTRDIDLNYRVIGTGTGAPRLELASEHNVAAQPTPAVLRNIRICYDDTGSSGPGMAIRFRYLVDGSEVSTVSTTLFSGIHLSGITANSSLTSTVLQTPAGRLELGGLLVTGTSFADADFSLYATGGFFARRDMPNDQAFRMMRAAPNHMSPAGTFLATTADNVQIVGLVAAKGLQLLQTGLDGLVQMGANTSGTTTVRAAVSGRGLHIGSALTDPMWTSGNGSPESSVAAPVGSFYIRKDGTAGTLLYHKQTGTGNTGWVALH